MQEHISGTSTGLVRSASPAKCHFSPLQTADSTGLPMGTSHTPFLIHSIFSFPPFKEAVFIWLELVSRAWVGLWALCLNPQTITNMAGCLVLLISYQQCFIFPSVVSFWISRALLISCLPLWDATVEHYGIQICQWAESISLICLDNKTIPVAFR